MNNQTIKFILTLAVIIFIGWRLAADNKNAVELGQAMKLDQHTPSNSLYRYAFDLGKNQTPSDPQENKKLKEYYQLIVDRFPQMIDARGLLGFVVFNQGKKDEAIFHYKKALDGNPTFFWFYFNLGIIYFAKEDHGQAARYFEEALQLNPALSMKFILSSGRVYLPILYQSQEACAKVDCSMHTVDQDKLLTEIKNQFEAGYKDALAFLILSNDRLGKLGESKELIVNATAMGVPFKEVIAGKFLPTQPALTLRAY